MATILITGGSGTVGSALIPQLNKKGHDIRVLSRSNISMEGAAVFQWDVAEGKVDQKALEGVDHIIHLAGYNVSEGRWTERRKQLIHDSRIKAVDVLKANLNDQKIKSFISASGVSIYGTVTSDQIFSEEDQPNISDSDFLGEISMKWEMAAHQMKENAERLVILRTPVVLSKTDGALEKITAPIKKGIGAALGSGKQWMPWVHIDDLVEAYVMAVENAEMNGTFNICAPDHVNNKTFTKTCAAVLGRKIWLPNVPRFALKLVFGQMANIILKGSRVNGEKIKKLGFDYKYPQLKIALNDLLVKQ